MAIAVLGVVAAIGLAIRLFVEERLAADMQQDLESRAINLAATLAAESVEPILYQDQVTLEQLLNTPRTTWNDFQYAFVLDPTRNVLAHTLIGDFPEELRRMNRLEAGSVAQVQRLHVLGFLHRDLAVPIYDGELGVLHLGFRDESIIARLNTLRRDVAGLLAVVAAVGGLSCFGLALLGLRPLNSIAKTLETFQPGRMREEIPVRSNDEIGKIAQRINEMTLRLHQAQIALDDENRLATLGRFSSVIVHEVGNPLASIMTRLELMEKSNEERFLRDSLPVVRGQLGRIQKFLRGLSGVSRASQGEASWCDINEVVREVADVLRYDPRTSTVRVETELADMRPIWCVRDQLFQALLNLGLNGLRAAGPSGTVVFSTKSMGKAALIEIADDGPGVPVEIQGRIFEPSFSTSTGGAGLGLTISRDLVRQQGGDLRLVTRDCQGACFQVQLSMAHPSKDEMRVQGST
jgi:signal transduction histidine kinase